LINLSPDEKKVFRKRVIECILATDMSKHTTQISGFKQLIDQNQIKAGSNTHTLLNKENEASLFRSQQDILNIICHASDISGATRPHEISATWTILLTEEFFN
jgi:hypothetical protein